MTSSVQTMPTEKDRFRDAMAAFPSGVTIVTTTDADGRWWGFTATSFCSVSMEPPLVLVCLAHTAECHPVFDATSRWMVHVIPPEHADLAIRFATRGADKFGGSEFVATEGGLPDLPGASVTLECDLEARHVAGDHTILIGRVRSTRVGEIGPVTYFRRAFHAIPRADGTGN